MRLTKQLLEKNNEQERDKKKKKVIRDDEPEDDLIQFELPQWKYLNDDHSDVFESKLNSGINTEKSIFDKYAVFKTNRN